MSRQDKSTWQGERLIFSPITWMKCRREREKRARNSRKTYKQRFFCFFPSDVNFEKRQTGAEVSSIPFWENFSCR